MEKSLEEETDKSWPLIREKIKAKYEQHCLENGKDYTSIPFNSTPDHYEYLVKSFKEKLSLLLEKSEDEVEFLIPSESTFARIYRTGYRPTGEKLRGCYLYATGKSKAAFEKEYYMRNTFDSTESITTVDPKSIFTGDFKLIFNICFGLAIIIGLLTYVVGNYQRFVSTSNTLILNWPTNGKVVPVKVLASGRVSNGHVVWIVIHKVGTLRYWVQPPIKVNDDGTWKGPIYFGDNPAEDIGSRVEMQAFVNPVKLLENDEALYSWPNAEFSSPIVEVIRGSGTRDLPKGLTVEQPLNGQTVPRLAFIKGRALNADTVWTVVLDMKHNAYYVQLPIKIGVDDIWKGSINIGGNAKEHIGLRFKVRTFINPSTSLKVGDVLRSWPAAELSSKPINVIRGSKTD